MFARLAGKLYANAYILLSLTALFWAAALLGEAPRSDHLIGIVLNLPGVTLAARKG